MIKRLGIDIGSQFFSCVTMEDGRVTSAHYREHKGDISKTLDSLREKIDYHAFDRIGVTGHRQNRGNSIIDNRLAVIHGIHHLLPESRNIFWIGGQTFMLVFFDERGRYTEHTSNPPCASGTGSFIDQQAERLKLTINEFTTVAEKYTGPVPEIATRCAVYAKSDIIHSMQKGYTVDAVCKGICESIARNILDSLVRGRALSAPVGITGGVSLNSTIVSSIGKMTGVEVKVPQYSHLGGAVGAALLAEDNAFDFSSLKAGNEAARKTREALILSLSSYPDFSALPTRLEDGVEIHLLPEAEKDNNNYFFGLDIGSTSTKACVMDENDTIIAGFYTRTEGNPVEAVKRILHSANKYLPSFKTAIKGAATTGSGRNMIRDLFLADMAINEISAHALAAVKLSPEADTIIEIGGQDSKLTLLQDREVCFSQMNYVCAAGTGSFIEEQARRLGIGLEEFSDTALGAVPPYSSDRCTVYMERDLGFLLSEGWSKETVAAAVIYSVRDNYLAKVVNKTPLGRHIVFQGATARNKALVAAFENYTGKPIHVSPFCHLTGAYGAAIACRQRGITATLFMTGFSSFEVREETCRLCTNQCLLTVAHAGDRISAFGMKCGREYTDRKRKGKVARVLAAGRFEKTYTYETDAKSNASQNVTALLMDTLYNREYNLLWEAFLKNLGCGVKRIKNTREDLKRGKGSVNSDFCAPIILSHGVMEKANSSCRSGDSFSGSSPDFIFSPAVENSEDSDSEELFSKKTHDSYHCYYSQYLPTITANLTAFSFGDKLAAPFISLNPFNTTKISASLFKALENRLPGLNQEKTEKAFIDAYDLFNDRLREYASFKPEQTNGKMTIVLAGRPYVIFDPVMNLGIPDRLQDMGIDLLYMDELDKSGFEPGISHKYLDKMHWKYGKKILTAAEIVARSDNLFFVYLTCFRCSPDSFITGYVRDIMAAYGKPFLILQLDEHTQDTGYTTRLEAAVHSFSNAMKKADAKKSGTVEKQFPRDDSLTPEETVFVPLVNPLVSRLWAASFKKAGFDSHVLESDERALSTGYRYANGGECMPAVAIAGGVLNAIKDKNLQPGKTFLYLPTVCMACNFPQFPILADMVFSGAGFPEIKIGQINSLNPGGRLPGNTEMKIFESSVIASTVYKMYYRVRAYELNKGEAQSALKFAGNRMEKAILDGEDLKTVFEEISSRFKGVPLKPDGYNKPRIAILGDLYLKYNDTVNHELAELIIRHECEVLLPSFTEMTFHFFDVDSRISPNYARKMKLLKIFESRYESMARDIIGHYLEPEWKDCLNAMERYHIFHYIPGETSINSGRALYSLYNKQVDAIVHVNPMFCCPGVVTASLFRKMQKDFSIPIIDLFYDGTADPNAVLIPQLHYLKSVKGLD
ncbi:MAG: hypothetical protein JW969_11020 [Spirochaetales bacterium]|nr:hypothetical protein [Spirochaetales bacterium]